MTWEYAQATHEISQAGSLIKYKLAFLMKGYEIGLSKGRVQGAIGGIAGTLAVCAAYKGGIFLYERYRQSRNGNAQSLGHLQEDTLLLAAEESRAQEHLALPGARPEAQTALNRLRKWLADRLPPKVVQAVGLAS